MEIKILQIVIPSIFIIGIVTIIYTFFKEPKQISKDFVYLIFSTIKDRFQGLLAIPLIPFKILYLLFFHGGRLKKEDYQGDLQEKKSNKPKK